MSVNPSSKSIWIGRTFSTLTILFMLMDAIMKFVKPPTVVKATVELGFPEPTLTWMAIALLVSTIMYTIPRTAVLGAILLTGYLGGAVAANLRVGHPLFAETLFPVYFAAIVWAGLGLRSPRLREAVFAGLHHS
jgi:DoxX-like family